jgi:hypothetical protein
MDGAGPADAAGQTHSAMSRTETSNFTHGLKALARNKNAI